MACIMGNDGEDEMSTTRRARAARLKAHGKPLEIEEVELPQPGDDEVLVELQFGGVNPIDRYLADGRVAPDAPLPRTLGGEASGTAAGRPVLVAGEGLGAVRDGVWAEVAVVPRASVIELPGGVELREAAAMGIAGLTAYNVVRELAGVSAEDRVLVLGASGGVGTIIVSLARDAGATVWGQVGSPGKADVVEQQGAHGVLVAGPEELAGALAELAPTIVFDPLGDGFVQPAIDSLAVGGRLVSFGASAGAETKFNIQTLYRKSLSLLGYGGMQLGREERRRGLEAALAALADGQLRVVIDDVLALDQVGEAFARLERRAVTGKLLLATR
jgi:NADPH2:quinone reductase